MPWRDSILNRAPPWLLDFVGSRLLYIGGLAADLVEQWLDEGIKARWPDRCDESALGYIGNDRLIDRGPAESSGSYRVRLRQAIDTWRNAGGARTILSELAAVCSGLGTPPMRLVSDSSVWHEYNWTTGMTTKTVVSPANWIWDSYTGTRWWRGWAIVDMTAGPVTRQLWGSGGDLWGSTGRLWGVSDPNGVIAAMIRVLRKWKPAHVDVHYLILTFNPSLFERTDASPPNPNGNYDNPANWNTDAVYISAGT